MWVTTRTRSPNTVLLRVFWGLDTVHWCNNGQFDRLTVKCNECGILLHKKTPGRLIQTVPLNDIERTVLTLDSSETSEWIYRRAIQPTGSNQTMPIPQGTRDKTLSYFREGRTSQYTSQTSDPGCPRGHFAPSSPHVTAKPPLNLNCTSSLEKLRWKILRSQTS